MTLVTAGRVGKAHGRDGSFYVAEARYPFDLINRLKGRVSRAADEHDEVLRAFIGHDAAAAMLATRQHIEAGWQELHDSLRPSAEIIEFSERSRA